MKTPLICGVYYNILPAVFSYTARELQQRLLQLFAGPQQLRQFRQQIPDVIVDIQAVRTSCFHNAVSYSACLYPADRIHCYPILPSNREISQRTFTCRIVDWHFPVRQEYLQALLLVQAEGIHDTGAAIFFRPGCRRTTRKTGRLFSLFRTKGQHISKGLTFLIWLSLV